MKKIVFFLVLLCAALNGFSQSFMHGIGLNVVVANASGGQTAVNGGISYSPRFNFIEQDNMSVSVGVPFTVGVSGALTADYNSQTGSSSSNTLSLLLNVPVLVNLNMGAGSSKETESRFGYFVGAGYGYHHGTYNISGLLDGYEATSFSTTGPVANAGIRFGVGSGTHNIEVRFQYMKGLNDVKPNIFSAGAAFNF